MEKCVLVGFSPTASGENRGKKKRGRLASSGRAASDPP